MNAARFIFADTLAFIAYPLLRLHFWKSNYRRHQEGGCSFWGPDGFIQHCEDALGRIAVLDGEMHRQITRGGQIVFWYSPKTSERIQTAFGVDDSFCAWGSDGICARIIHAAYTLAIVGSGRGFESKGRMTVENLALVHDCTRAWLEKFRFPPELVRAFDRER